MSYVAGHQPNLYPYGGFFAKIANVDKFVIADNTQYVKKEYHNRNRIKLLDGSVIWLTVPVKNAGHYRQKINEAEIDNSLGWKKKHEKTLLVNYKKTPFFDQYFPKFSEHLSRKWRYLADYNIAFIKLFLGILEIETPVSIASKLDISGNSTGFILDICRKTDSDTYMHGKHALDYVDFALLREAGIKNYIQSFQAVEYKQATGDFEPNLSILDILFNCGPESKKIIMKGHSATLNSV